MKLRNFILIGSFAAMAATGAAMAQSGSGSAGASGSTSGASASGSTSGSSTNPADRMPTDPTAPLNDAKNKLKKNAPGTPSTSPNGNPTGPISVTPPSQDNPNTAVDVNTDPAKAHAAAGTNGVNANAQLNATSPDQATPKGTKKKSKSGQ
ncbi:MAG TPA: hypothetical protein VFB36_08040 [Nevskiaceae bacterium]|nr:hypothetical protein [Nevskiaceae bacterium]